MPYIREIQHNWVGYKTLEKVSQMIAISCRIDPHTGKAYHRHIYFGEYQSDYQPFSIYLRKFW